MLVPRKHLSHVKGCILASLIFQTIRVIEVVHGNSDWHSAFVLMKAGRGVG